MYVTYELLYDNVGGSSHAVENVFSISYESSRKRGFGSATIEVALNTAAISYWYERLGAHIFIWNDLGDCVWHGIINTVSASVGSDDIRYGPILDIQNRVRVDYTTVSWNTNPPTGGDPASTDWAEDHSSIARFGTMEYIESAGEMDEDQALALRDTLLTENTFPVITSTYATDSNNATLRLECVGLFSFLEKYYYQQTDTSELVDVGEFITSVLQASPNIYLGIPHTISVPSLGVDTNSYIEEATSAASLIESAMDLTTGYRYGFFRPGVFEITPIPEKEAWVKNHGEPGLYTAGGSLLPVDLTLVKPGDYILVRGTLSRRQRVDSVRYNWPQNQLSVNFEVFSIAKTFQRLNRGVSARLTTTAQQATQLSWDMQALGDVHNPLTLGTSTPSAGLVLDGPNQVLNLNLAADGGVIFIGTNTVRLNLGTNSGLTIASEALIMGTPSDVSASSANNVSGVSHTHNVAATTNAATSTGMLLKADASGYLTLGKLITDAIDSRTGPVTITGSGRIYLDGSYTQIDDLLEIASDSTGTITRWTATDVDHGMTNYEVTNSFGRIRKVGTGTSAGGLGIDGFTESAVGLLFRGFATSPNTGTGTGATGATQIISFKKSGTGAGDLASNENVLVVRNNATTVMILKGDGTLHVQGTYETYDKYDDVHLLRALEIAQNPAQVIRNRFDDILLYNEDTLREAGIIGESARMLNVTQTLKLTIGAIIQMATKVADLEDEIRRLRA